MRILQVTSRLSAEIKKLYIYYFIYSLLFIFLHLVMVSTFSFFHFLLNHDMSTIENWLNRNTWEILSMSKLASLIFTGQIVKLNHYSDIKFQDFFSDQSLWPSKKIFGMSLFILTIFYALIIQFGGGVVQNQFKEELFYSSFLGSFLFYMADFVMVYFLVLVFEIPRRHLLRLIYPCLFLFLVTSKVALPYLNKFHVFLVVHYFTLFLIA
ncbi:MAG: hypothetical protein OEW87_15545, partial [Flavobacteriaceae bacterium]|nr:hypothetical protein [Flavobacteriaceae bacterium]